MASQWELKMKALNEWYDGLPEPRRFLLFFGFVGIPLTALFLWSQSAALALAAIVATARLWPWR